MTKMQATCGLYTFPVLEHCMVCSRCSINIYSATCFQCCRSTLLKRLDVDYILIQLPYKDSLLPGPSTTWVSQSQGVETLKNQSADQVWIQSVLQSLPHWSFCSRLATEVTAMLDLIVGLKNSRLKYSPWACL